ncbi:MAG: cardiolipin synthase [Ruminococcus sp.]|nr:cardiolipin synthase [Ruminococcus sp.]
MKKDIDTSGGGELIRLLPKHRKGLLRILFSRFIIILILILLQIVITAALSFIIYVQYPFVYAADRLFSLIMVFYLFRCDMDSTAKLTWLLILMLAPIPGAILLLYTRKELGHNFIRKRSAQLTAETRGMITSDEKAFRDPDILQSGTDDLCRYLNRTGCFPLFSDTDVTYFHLGEKKFAAMLEELQKAEKFIFMEYFIIDEGYMWGRILSILAEKVRQGVEVRVMYDGMCEITTLSHDYPQRMAELGIRCKAFAPIRPVLSTYYNYRDHRKILVIDGNVAFNGGVNLADEYINRTERFGHWKDAAVMIKGKAVKSFTLMFLHMWNITERSPEWGYLPEPAVPETSSGYVMPYADCPLDEYKVGECIYMDMLNRATTYVHIMTPYLILDGELEASLKFAAERGIDVKIILPGIPDKKGAFALARTHYRSLMKSGVQIYEYTPGFVHSKVFVCDGLKAVVGTINLDYRSLYHHFECATYMYRTDCITDIEEDFLSTLSLCRRADENTVRREKLSYKIRGSILKLIAPLL